MPNLVNPVKRAKFIKFLEFKGFELISCKGDHFKYNSLPKQKRPLILTLIEPMPREYIKKTLKIINCSIEEYLIILEEL